MIEDHFSGKTALVTGAGAGIGEASARAFAARGARVMVADIKEAEAAAVAQAIRDSGGEAEAIGCDATDEDAVIALIETTLARFGSLDFAHNNVGCGTGKPIEELTAADYEFTMNLTFKTVYLGLRHELPIMRARGGGVIVNTASMAGVSTTPASDMIYSGAKAGVIQMTAYAARAYAPHNIRVNCIAPGLVATKVISEMFTPEQQAAMAGDQLFKRPLRPDEIAASVMFLCSPDAAMITGLNLPVDGGINAVR
jgi:NAD(P)-dependent dehydrogenase (short-subunit alcohol dehydrogenase family)